MCLTGFVQTYRIDISIHYQLLLFDSWKPILTPTLLAATFIKRIKHYFPGIKICQAQVDALQLEPQSGWGCNRLSHKGSSKIYTEKNVISSLLYTFLSKRLPGLNGNDTLSCCALMRLKHTPLTGQ